MNLPLNLTLTHVVTLLLSTFFVSTLCIHSPKGLLGTPVQFLINGII